MKFVKYLKKFNWDPIVYTTERNGQDLDGPSLEKDIPGEVETIRQKIREPSHPTQETTDGMDESIATGNIPEKKKKSLVEKISALIRGANDFIIDDKEYWVKPSVKFLTGYLKTKPVDLIAHRTARTELPWS